MPSEGGASTSQPPPRPLTRMIRSERCRRRILFSPSRRRMKPSSRAQSPVPAAAPGPSPYTSQWPSPSATRLAPPAGSNRKRVRQNFSESMRLWRRASGDCQDRVCCRTEEEKGTNKLCNDPPEVLRAG